MPLSPDQQATLQLLLMRGQRYGDLAALLNVEETEVRRRARSALVELGGADPDRNVGLTDYLLGQADPIGRADAVRHIQSDPETAALAARIAAQLQLIAPDADLPDLPRAKGAKVSRVERPPRETAPAGATAGDGSGSRLARLRATAGRWWHERRPQAIAILTVLAALIVVGILALTGVLGGDDDDEASQPAQLGYPVSPLGPDKQGRVQGSLPLTSFQVEVLADAETVDVSAVSLDSLSPSLETAVEEGLRYVTYQGTGVLRGSLNPEDLTANEQGVVELTGEGEASGTIGLGVDQENQQVGLNLDFRGLERLPEGEIYILWFLPAPGTENEEVPEAAAGGVPAPGGVPQPEAGQGQGGGGGAGGGE
jgi:hypothetical protein